MRTVTFQPRGFPIIAVTLGDDGQAVEIVERDESGEVVRRWETEPAGSQSGSQSARPESS